MDRITASAPLWSKYANCATLIGNGPDVLTKVKMVGNDMELDAGVGTCGKNGQWVPQMGLVR